ncbi:putative ribosome-binding factor A, mitochondrial [Engraulis encrasicolus]|uniref:putative ribosome-binding factor A, mitochondrial n=1 Tax=Engraulis encrasicolus TaxID=184585 RepID=UPI002FD0413D
MSNIVFSKSAMLSQTIIKIFSFRQITYGVLRISIPRPTTKLGDGLSPGCQHSFHTCSCFFGGNKLMKMFKGRSKKQWYETPPQRIPTSQSLFKPTKPRQEDSFRLRALNSILFKAVSDLLTSYEVSSELPKLNVEISKVSLAPDHSACRVYWKTGGTSEKDEYIQQVLDKSGRRIRYLLLSQQVLGSIPAMVFIRDKQYAALNEIDNLLKIADFGPNHEQLEDATSELERSGAIRTASSGLDQFPPSEGRPVLFGIDHDALLKQVQEYKQQTGETAAALTTTTALTQQQVEAIAEFKKQKLIEKKKKKSKKNIDNDITPKAFLLAKHGEEKPLEDLDDDRHEDSQIRELMAEDHRRP